MKKHIIFALLVSFLGITGSASAAETSMNWHALQPYVGVEGMAQRSYVRSGGFITRAPTFTNHGLDTNEGMGVGLVAGLNNLYKFDDRTRLRGELEYVWHDSQNFSTDSCANYAGCGALFRYHGQVKSRGGFVNAYIDRDITNTLRGHPVSLFAGGGIGAFNNDAKASDEVIYGSADDISFAYQLGGGAKVGLSQGVDLVLGARYMNLGLSKLDMRAVGGGTPSGTLKLDNNSAEARIGINIAFDRLLRK